MRLPTKKQFSKAILIVCLIFLVSWVIVALVAYNKYGIDVWCAQYKSFTIFSIITFFTSIIGTVIFFATPGFRHRAQYLIKYIPDKLESALDSGVTPYFNPAYYRLKNGMYKLDRNPFIKPDVYGLPIVEPTVPLNSFNMEIYKKYRTNYIDDYKSIQQMLAKEHAELNDDMMEQHAAMFLDAVKMITRIEIIGDTCVVARSWNKGPLLIHKSDYVNFVADSLKKESWAYIIEEEVQRKYRKATNIYGVKWMMDQIFGFSVNKDYKINFDDPTSGAYSEILYELFMIYKNFIVSESGIDDQALSYLIAGLRELLTQDPEMGLASIIPHVTSYASIAYIANKQIYPIIRQTTKLLESQTAINMFDFFHSLVNKTDGVVKLADVLEYRNAELFPFYANTITRAKDLSVNGNVFDNMFAAFESNTFMADPPDTHIDVPIVHLSKYLPSFKKSINKHNSQSIKVIKWIKKKSPIQLNNIISVDKGTSVRLGIWAARQRKNVPTTIATIAQEQKDIDRKNKLIAHKQDHNADSTKLKERQTILDSAKTLATKVLNLKSKLSMLRLAGASKNEIKQAEKQLSSTERELKTVEETMEGPMVSDIVVPPKITIVRLDQLKNKIRKGDGIFNFSRKGDSIFGFSRKAKPDDNKHSGDSIFGFSRKAEPDDNKHSGDSIFGFSRSAESDASEPVADVNTITLQWEVPLEIDTITQHTIGDSVVPVKYRTDEVVAAKEAYEDACKQYNELIKEYNNLEPAPSDSVEQSPPEKSRSELVLAKIKEIEATLKPKQDAYISLLKTTQSLVESQRSKIIQEADEADAEIVAAAIDSNDEAATLMAHGGDLKRTIEEKSQSLADKQSELHAVERRIDEINQSIKDLAVPESVAQVLSDIIPIIEKTGEMDAALQKGVEQYKKIDSELELIRQQNQDLLHEAANRATALSNLQAQLDEVQGKLAMAQTERADIYSNLNDVVSERDSMRRQLSGVISERDSMRGQLSGVISERDSMRGQLSGVISERDSMLGQLSSVVSERDSMLGQLSSVVSERDSMLGQLSSVVSERDSMHGQLSSIAAEKARLQQQYDQETQKLQRELASISSEKKAANEKIIEFRKQQEIEKQELKEALKLTMKDIESRKRANDALSGTNADLAKELNAQLERERNEATKKMEQLDLEHKRQMNEILADVENMKNAHTKLEEEHTAAQAKLKERIGTQHQLEMELAKSRNANSELEMGLYKTIYENTMALRGLQPEQFAQQTADGYKTALNDLINDFAREMEQGSANITTNDTNLKELENQKKSLEMEITRMNSEKVLLLAKNAELEKQLSAVVDKDNQIKNLTQQLNSYMILKREAEAEVGELTVKRNSLVEELNTVTSELKEAKRKVSLLDKQTKEQGIKIRRLTRRVFNCTNLGMTIGANDYSALIEGDVIRGYDIILKQPKPFNFNLTGPILKSLITWTNRICGGEQQVNLVHTDPLNSVLTKKPTFKGNEQLNSMMDSFAKNGPKVLSLIYSVYLCLLHNEDLWTRCFKGLNRSPSPTDNMTDSRSPSPTDSMTDSRSPSPTDSMTDSRSPSPTGIIEIEGSSGLKVHDADKIAAVTQAIALESPRNAPESSTGSDPVRDHIRAKLSKLPKQQDNLVELRSSFLNRCKELFSNDSILLAFANSNEMKCETSPQLKALLLTYGFVRNTPKDIEKFMNTFRL